MKKRWLKVLVFAGAGLALLVVARYLLDDFRDAALWLLALFEGLGRWGAILYILLYALVIIALIPTLLFTLGAGYLFGFIGGILITATAMAIGCTAAFLMARHLFGDAAARKLREHPKLATLNRALAREGWKIVLLTRLLPIFPFKLSNYFFGLTSISLRGFFLGNLAGIMPISFFNVYLGSLAADLGELLDRKPVPLEWTLYGAAIFVSIGLLYYMTHLARQSMHRAMRDPEE